MYRRNITTVLNSCKKPLALSRASCARGEGSGISIWLRPSINHKGASTPRMQVRIRQKLPVVIWKLSRMAASGGRPRSTSRYSANTRLIITQIPGRMNSAAPAMISSELSITIKANDGHRRRAMASRLRLSGV
ncbi:hypothetical protein D3C76_971040 [compost metagenome]